MFCWDADSCAERYADHQYWMSSSNWAPTMAQGGIFNPQGGASAWGNANRCVARRTHASRCVVGRVR
jgi:hypothetical protein